MAMVCTRCNTTHEQALHCPTCGAALVYHQPRKRGRNYAEMARGWQHSDGGRFLIGVGLSQGLFYGLYHLVKSIVLAATGEPLNSQSNPLMELVCIQGLQLFGLVAGCVIAGVARRQAIVLGVYVGAANSILSLIFGQWPVYSLTTYWVYAQPLIQIAAGSVSSLLSSVIWKPLALVTLPETPSRMAKKLGAKRPRILKLFGGSVAWFRVGLGALVASAGCLAAPMLLDLMLSLSDGLSVGEYLQESVLTWEIRGLALLLGGVLAGVGTANGVKQGMMTGVVAGVILNVALALRHSSLEVEAVGMLLSFCVALIGGWFGGQLFPPLVPRSQLKGLGHGTI